MWRDGDVSGVLKRSFSGVLKMCGPEATGVICVFVTLLSYFECRKVFCFMLIICIANL